MDEGTPHDGVSDVRFRCPGCDEDVDVSAAAVGQLVRCPYCNTSFFAADGHIHADVVDDTDRPPPDDAPPPDELDAVRIRHLSTLRRATLRARSWWVIAALLAAATAFDLLVKAARNAVYYHAWTGRATAFAIAAALAATAAWAAARQAARLGREASASALAPPVAEPDFTPLDNGSQRWRHLDQIR